MHLLHRYCFRPVLRRFASRRRQQQCSRRQRAQLQSRARNGRRQPSSSRHRYNLQLRTLYLRSRSCPHAPISRLLLPPRAKARDGANGRPRRSLRTALSDPHNRRVSDDLRSPVCFSFQMDMKSVGSFYYDNFVSILVCTYRLRSRLSFDLRIMVSNCLYRPSPAWCRTSDRLPTKLVYQCISRRQPTSN